MKKIFEALLKGSNVARLVTTTAFVSALGYVAHERNKYHSFQRELFELRVKQEERRERMMLREQSSLDETGSQIMNANDMADSAAKAKP